MPLDQPYSVELDLNWDVQGTWVVKHVTRSVERTRAPMPADEDSADAAQASEEEVRAGDQTAVDDGDQG